MTSRERVRLVMRHETPDRVPVMCQLALGHYFLHSEHKPAEIFYDSDLLIDTFLDIRERYQFDGMLINVPSRPIDWKRYLAESRQEADHELLIWKNGLETKFVADDNPHTFLTGGVPLPCADYDTVNPDDPGTYRTPAYVSATWETPELWDIAPDADLADPATYPEWYTRGLRRSREKAPDISIHQEVFSPFTHMMELFGYEEGLIALLDDPGICCRLLDKLSDIVSAQVKCYAPHAPDAILISSAFAGAGFLSREMYKQFVLPYERKVVETIHSFDLPAYTHTCGAIGDRLDLMAGTGIDGIDTLDPPPLGTVDLAEAKAEFGKQLFFKGNLDAVHEMLNADDETFEAAVRQRLEVGKPGSGYILSSACSVAPHVDPERLKTMVGLAEQHGKY